MNSLQYATLHQEQINPDFRPIHIKRRNFQWNATYFSLDEHDYIKGNKNAVILRFEAGKERDVKDIIPDWIKVIRDVRGVKEFQLSSIAKV